MTVRPARPDPGDAAHFARYLDLAGDGLFRWMLGRRSAAILAEAYPTPGHDLSYEHVRFAEVGGEVAGMLSGYTAADHARASDEPLEKAAGIHKLRLWAAGLLAAPVLGFMGRLAEGDWYLQAVAVDPAHRGAGIGSVLLDHAEQVARTTGCRRIVLDVAVDNEGARRLYERRGMAIEARSPTIPFTSGNAVYRMAVNVTPDPANQPQP